MSKPPEPAVPGQADRIPVFVDCDPGIDDAVALAYLLCQDGMSPNAATAESAEEATGTAVDIVGIAASGGNVPTRQVARNALGWLALAGRSDIPVHAGAVRPLAQSPEYADDTHGPTGTGYARLPEPISPASDTDAAHAWVDAARAHPGELIGIVLGPSTNLALALDIEPALPRLVKRLFIMGGAFNYRGNTRPTTEWNVTWDPEAAARVIAGFGASARHLPVIGPIEATEAVAVTPAHLARVLAGADTAPAPAAGAPTTEAGGPTAGPATASAADDHWQRFLVQLGEALRFYFEFHELDGHGYLAHVHDPYVLAAALGWARAARDTAAAAGPADSPAGTHAAAVPVPWATTATAPVDVETTGTLTRGETVADWLGRWDRPHNAEIIRTIDAPEFLGHLITTLRKGPHHVTNG